MEFFAIADTRTDQSTIQEKIRIQSLPAFCTSINMALESQEDRGEIFCIWGQFSICREQINGGVRFTLPTCPNAFAWTITTGYPPAPERIVVHCTMSRTELDEDFVESVQTFMNHWKDGIERHL